MSETSAAAAAPDGPAGQTDRTGQTDPAGTTNPADPDHPAGTPRPTRPAAFFDLDKTVIATSAAAAFARPLHAGGLLSRRAALRSAGAQLAFLLGSATEGRTERVRAQLSAMVTGWDVERVSAIVAASLDDAIGGVLHAEAVEIVAEHHAAGHDVVVVSASSEELVRPIAALIGADEVIATRMAVADGRYTGQIAFYAYGPAKAEAMRDLAERRGYDLAASSAYTDSVTDLPMLEAVGHGFVVNPDRALRERAEQEGWTVLAFRRPALLRTLRGPDRTTPGHDGRRSGRRIGVATGAVAAGVLGAAVVIGVARRRRSTSA